MPFFILAGTCGYLTVNATPSLVSHHPDYHPQKRNNPPSQFLEMNPVGSVHWSGGNIFELNTGDLSQLSVKTYSTSVYPYPPPPQKGAILSTWERPKERKNSYMFVMPRYLLLAGSQSHSLTHISKSQDGFPHQDRLRCHCPHFPGKLVSCSKHFTTMA